MITEKLTMEDGAKVNVVRFEPEGQIRGVVQFIHGFGEHTGRYVELAGRFTAQGMAFVIHDQRGHGQTPGNRGVAESYDLFLEDVCHVRNCIEAWYPGRPVLLYGHSMGGNIALNYLLAKSQTRHTAAVIGCPWLRLYMPLPGAVIGLAGMLGKLSPNLTMTQKMDLQTLTRDKVIVQTAEEDKEYHNTISFRLAAQISKRGEYAIAHAGELRLPLLLLCAGQDRLVSPLAIEEFFKNAGQNVQIKRYPEGYHELHNETNRGDIFEEVWAFTAEKLELILIRS